MIIDDGLTKYTTHRGLLAYFYEQLIYKPVYDEDQKWAMGLLMDWDGFTDYKRFEYLTKVMDIDRNIRDQAILIIEACRAQLDINKRDLGGEKFIAENKEELDTAQVEQLEQFIMKEFKEEVKQREHQEFSFQDKVQFEQENEEKIEDLKEEKVQKEFEEEKIEQDFKELKRQAKQKVTANNKKKQNQGRKKQNNKKNQKQDERQAESQFNKSQQQKQRDGQLVLKKNIQYEQYINYYQKQVEKYGRIKKSNTTEDSN